MATGHAPGILTGTIVTLALLFAAAACSDDSGSEKPQPTASGSTGQESAEARTVSVVTTTNIMADWVENIGGGNVNVFSLLPAGADPHTFQPGAQDVAKVSDADLVLSVGLGLEAAWLHDLLENAARDESAIVELGEIVDPIEFAQGHAGEVEDPHFWFDPPRVKLAVNDIAARLSMLDPDRGDTYSANASAYNARLDELHAWSEQQAGTVPEDRRLLVTSHDSFGYFANLYGFEVVGVVLSGTTDVEPSAGDLAELVEEVEEYGVPAVFGETTVSERLASTVASESGAELVRLYSGSLGLEGSGAETYIEMIRTNVGRIVEALK